MKEIILSQNSFLFKWLYFFDLSCKLTTCNLIWRILIASALSILMFTIAGSVLAAISWASYITFMTIGFTIGTYIGNIISGIPIFQILDGDGIINFYFGNFLIIGIFITFLYKYNKPKIKNNLITETYNSIKNKYCVPIRFK